MGQRAQAIHGLLTDLKCCSMRRELQWGRRLHAKALESGNASNMYVATALIKMYSKCGSKADPQRVFDNIKTPDILSWNSLLLGYADNGESHLTLDLFAKMKAAECRPDCVTYVAVLKACSSLAVNGNARGKAQALKIGHEIHLQIGDLLDSHIQCTLIDMYAKCCSMSQARQVFSSIGKPDVACWNALLLGYAENGEGRVSLELFTKMKADGCVPNSGTYVAALKACARLAANGDKKQGLEFGRSIHLDAGGHLNLYVKNTLIEMYAKCGSMTSACQVFQMIKKPEVISWTALLLGYADNGEEHVALCVFSKMKAEGCTPDSKTYVAVLKACTSLSVNGDDTGLAMGLEVHAEASGHLNRHVQNALINMYAKCGKMIEARGVFDSIRNPDVVSWTALLSGYVENGEGHVALDLFVRMKDTGCAPDSVTYIAAIKACGSTGALGLGRKLHSDISEFTVRVVSSLVDFYAKCGSMVEARAVFDQHPKARDVTTWNGLLAGYCSWGDSDSAFKLFEAMQDTGFRPDGVTFVCILLCCSHAGLVRKARQYLEAMSAQHGITPDVLAYNCMVDVLGRANQLFEAVSVLRRMPCNPSAVTWRTLLGACHKWKNAELGRMAFQSLLEMDKNAVFYTPMVHLYGFGGMREKGPLSIRSHDLHGSCETASARAESRGS